MSKKEFLDKLEWLLRDLAPSEREEAMQYYYDYFEDAGEENEEEIIASLGSPEKVAEHIRRETNGEPVGRQARAEERKLVKYADSYEQDAYEEDEHSVEKRGSASWSKKTWVFLVIAVLLIGVIVSVVKSGMKSFSIIDKEVFQVEHIEDLDEVLDAKYDISDQLEFDKNHAVISGDIDIRLDGTPKNIIISAGACEFNIQESPDDSIYLKAQKADKMQAYVDGDDCCVRIMPGKHVFGKTKRNIVQLYLPKDAVYENIQLACGAGVLKFYQLQAGCIIMELGAGEISGDNIIADELAVKAGVGNLELHHMKTNSLNADVSMGNLNLEGDVTNNANVACAMGNLDLLLNGGEKDFNFYIESAMGNLEIGSSSFSGMTNSKEIDNGAEKNVNVSCSMGNTTIKFTE